MAVSSIGICVVYILAGVFARKQFSVATSGLGLDWDWFKASPLVNTVRQLFHLSFKRKSLQRRIVTHIKRLGTQLRRVAKSLIEKDTEIRSDVESGSPKLKHPNVPTASGTKPLGTFPLSSSIDLVIMEFTEPVTPREMGGLLNKSTTDPVVPIGKELWRNAFHIVKMNRAMFYHGSANYQAHRQRTSSTSSASSANLKLDAIRVQSRLNALVPKLESLTPMQGKVAHRALI
ncbi:hypothetical protein HHX47_DHR1001305 [Lentinula edodes]|nr:hypothetical protein HHX47_DHR1001305 [Lentinula edodes]KAJ3919785.1 hypothetical protein F5877DRAFT_77709 [Lentinula edodes]